MVRKAQARDRPATYLGTGLEDRADVYCQQELAAA